MLSRPDLALQEQKKWHGTSVTLFHSTSFGFMFRSRSHKVVFPGPDATIPHWPCVDVYCTKLHMWERFASSTGPKQAAI